MDQQQYEHEYQQRKRVRLVLGLLFDGIGLLSFTVPLVGESFDLIWAPLSAFLIYRMYPGVVGKTAAIISFIEEAMPFLDFIPTFTLTWLYRYLWMDRQAQIAAEKDKPAAGD